MSTVSPTVSFVTKDGRVVEFRPRQRKKGPARGFAAFVQEHIRHFLKEEKSAPKAMQRVAALYWATKA
jgi:hypothetical protein